MTGWLFLWKGLLATFRGGGDSGEREKVHGILSTFASVHPIIRLGTSTIPTSQSTPPPSSPTDDMDDTKLLNEVLGTVKVHTVQLKRCLEQDQIMEALKAASSMLAELRTSSLSPKQYYELYMSVFDSLRHLSNYLYEAHTEGKHHLADLYELVQ